MFKNNLTICFLYLVFSCANPVEKDYGDNSSETLFPDLNLENGIEVVTWNIERFPKLGQRTIDSVANIINSLNADIYCLQQAILMHVWLHFLLIFRRLIQLILFHLK